MSNLCDIELFKWDIKLLYIKLTLTYTGNLKGIRGLFKLGIKWT